MSKIAAEIANSVQHKPIGIAEMTDALSTGATLTGAGGGDTGVAVTVSNG